MNSQRQLVHTSLIPIRWGDMDAYGHVNNTIYFRFMEQIRVEYLEQQGYRVMPQGMAPVIINASCTFLKPMSYPGIVEVRTFVGHPGRSSVQSYVDMLIDGELFAEGAAKIVWMDTRTGKSVAIPDNVRAVLEAE